MKTVKFGALDERGRPVPHDYGRRYYAQPSGASDRLVVGASGGGARLLSRLAESFAEDDYYVLYVLVVSRTDRAPGRYQSPLLGGIVELRAFLERHEDFLDGDGRHHVWVGSPTSRNLLVYDQHDVVFCYGDLDACEGVLAEEGYERTDDEFWFPAPHEHFFNPEQDEAEERLLGSLDWTRFELRDGDEWD